MSESIRVGDKVAVTYEALVVVQSADGSTVTVPHPTKEGGQPIVFPVSQVRLVERAPKRLPQADGAVIRVLRWRSITDPGPAWVAMLINGKWRFPFESDDDTAAEVAEAVGSDFEVVYDPEAVVS